MPNPYVVRVDRDAFWNRYRSSPIPALQMRRPPRIVEESLYRGRWPESGPYAGQSFPPYAYGEQGELTPIQQPLPEGEFPNPPSEMSIDGLGATSPTDIVPTVLNVGTALIPLAAAAVSTYHGYKRNGDSIGWALAWGFGGWVLWPIVPVIAFAEGYAQPAKPKFRKTAFFTE